MEVLASAENYKSNQVVSLRSFFFFKEKKRSENECSKEHIRKMKSSHLEQRSELT